MSTPIKPPGPGDVPRPDEQNSEIGSAEKPSAPFKDVLDSTQKVGQQAPVESAAVDPVRALAQQLGSGAIDVETAVDKLVERALSGVLVDKLSAQQRDEIETILREALQSDPALTALIKDLERST
jgi:hypothetical protein